MEELLKELGFAKCRARFDGTHLRVEVPIQDIPYLAISNKREAIVQKARNLNIPFISLDLEGFVSGKLNRIHLEGNP